MKLSPAELARVEGYLNERRGDMVDTLCRLVSIPSVSRNDPDPCLLYTSPSPRDS